MLVRLCMLPEISKSDDTPKVSLQEYFAFTRNPRIFVTPSHSGVK